MFTISGTVHKVFSEEQLSAKLRKRSFVVEYAVAGGQQVQYLKFDVFQERCAEAEKLLQGYHVEIDFELRGRLWVNPRGHSVYINSLEAILIRIVK